MKSIDHIVIASNTSYDSLEDLQACLSSESRKLSRLYVIDDKLYRKLWSKGILGLFWLRILMYIIYPLKLSIRILSSSRNCCFIVTSATFYAPLLAAILGKIRGVKVVHLLYDLFPEALYVESDFKTGMFYTIIGWVTKYTQKNCSATVYLGNTLKKYTLYKWGSAKINSVIDVGVDAKRYIYSDISKHIISPLPIRYGGQLGRMHDAEQFSIYCNAIASHFNEKIKIDIFASGKGVKAFLNFSNQGIHIYNPRLDPAWRTSLSKYPIGLISLNPYAGLVCLPSKIYSMLASGQAIIALAPIWSDVAQIIINNDAGWVINTSKAETLDDFIKLINNKENVFISNNTIKIRLIKLIESLIDNNELIYKKRINARQAAINKFDLSVLKEKWSRLIHQLSFNEK